MNAAEYWCRVVRVNWADDLTKTVLANNWFGTLDDPASPAAMAEKLGYPLVVTRTLKPTWWQQIRSFLVDEGTKELTKFLVALVIGTAIVWATTQIKRAVGHRTTSSSHSLELRLLRGLPSRPVCAEAAVGQSTSSPARSDFPAYALSERLGDTTPK
jgi:hypothetical protein